MRGRGYVLDFSDRSFSQFFAVQLDVDIEDSIYADHSGSKGKRLRCFLEKADDATVAGLLRALWEHRVELLASTGQPDPVAKAEGRFLSLISRLDGGSGEPSAASPEPTAHRHLVDALRTELIQVRDLQPHQRGYAFEVFLKHAFDAAGLEAREPFRNTGEQIDGSFVLDHEVYLLEAKWHSGRTPASDLHAFHGKLERKAVWTRGLFVSFTGFSTEGLAAFGTGKRIICMDGRDIYDALTHEIPIRSVLERKVRQAAETGRIQVPVRDLFGLQAS